jgi:hypothetical protein
MEATFRLGQDNGVSGPHATREVEDVVHAKESAVAWAMGQTGHPWDCLTVSIPEIEYEAEIREITAASA